MLTVDVEDELGFIQDGDRSRVVVAEAVTRGPELTLVCAGHRISPISGTRGRMCPASTRVIQAVSLRRHSLRLQARWDCIT